MDVNKVKTRAIVELVFSENAPMNEKLAFLEDVRLCLVHRGFVNVVSVAQSVRWYFCCLALAVDPEEGAEICRHSNNYADWVGEVDLKIPGTAQEKDFEFESPMVEEINGSDQSHPTHTAHCIVGK